MSWLYSIVFAGLLLSSGGDNSASSTDVKFIDATQTRSVFGDEIEKFEQTYPLTPNGRVSLCNINGSIVVEAWDRNEVRLEATKIADSRETLAMLELEIDARPDYLKVEAKFKEGNYYDKGYGSHNRRLEVQFRLQVPRAAVLNEIGTVNGSVAISNFTNVTKVSAVNGSVTASNLRGTTKLSTVNGEVKVDFDRLESGSTVSLDTVNGRVSVLLPSDVNATLKADSLNGSISNEFGLPVKKGKYIGRNLYGRIGTGDVQIKLNTVNGGLAIGKKKDGRSPNPVTNLLKDADVDSDDDSDDVSTSERVDRSVNRAVRTSNRTASKALKDSHKALEKIKPDLEKIKIENLKNLSIVLNDKVIQDAVKDGVRQAEAIVRMSDADWTSSPLSMEKRTKSFDVKGTPRVTIDAPQCKVRVRGWDQPTVKYVLTEATESRAPMTVTETASDTAVTIKVTDGTKNKRTFFFGNEQPVRLEVFVPRKSNLKVITEEEIRVEGVSGEIDLSGGSGSVSVRDVDGSMRLSSNDGMVRVVGFRGELDLKTTDGEIYLEGDFDKITSRAVDSRITLTLPEDRNVTISTNTAIESEGLNIVRQNGRSWRLGSGDRKYNFEFTDGKLTVRNASFVQTN